MYIKNSTRNVIISRNAKLCRNIFSKTLGLMFSRKNKSLIFIFKEKKIVPLHMFFVFYPIDVLFLDENKTVVEIKENFKPFSFYTPRNTSKYVIELSKDTIKNSKTKIKDKIELIPTRNR
jgi:uncharacterized protein